MTEKPTLAGQFEQQEFTNGYALVNGVAMHAENGNRFQIPPDVLKKHVTIGEFVELRTDSPRFSVHEDAIEKCFCPTCHGEATQPILRHEQPASLVALPEQNVPSRGWGEDFWIQVTRREDDHFAGTVDNPLVEFRLHGLHQGDEVFFHGDHILTIHDIHRLDLLSRMDTADLKQLASWLADGQSLR